MVSIIFGILRAKALLGSLFLVIVAWWARKQGNIEAKVEYVARPVISPKRKR